MKEEAFVLRFFSALADRYCDENSLSDITYAMCKAVKDFMKLFLNFLFGKDFEAEDMEREYPDGSSRPDLFLHDMNRNEYLIEVKINDKNQHFAQYKNQFPNAEYAFIANYDLNEVNLNNDDKKALPSWNVKTWKNFKEALEKEKSELIDEPLVKGYVEFLKRAIKLKEFKKMNMNKPDSFPVFGENIEKIVNDRGFYRYNYSKPFDDKHYGCYFYKNDLYFWFGYYFPDGKIYIGFKDNVNWIGNTVKPYLDQNIGNINPDEFYEKPYKDPTENYIADYWFSMKKDKFDVLCDEQKSLAEQEAVLKGFFESVLIAAGAVSYL